MKNTFFILLIFTVTLQAQTINMLTSGTKTSFRGLSVVSDRIIWASGNNGTVVVSVDSGASWKWIIVQGFEKTDFRDIEAFDSLTAVIMGVAEPAYILKTADGGRTWKIAYENKAVGMFLDAMDFKGEKNGIVIGDPLHNSFFIAQTSDGGDTWIESGKNFSLADSGEACFASSGTNVRLGAKGRVYFVSGGLRSRLFMKDKIFTPPILQGSETTGANSVALKNKRTLIITGGDFKVPASTLQNCVITYNKGRTWILPTAGPHGYRSCVEYINNNKWITCGLNGVDYSVNNGKTWKLISAESFHVCRKAKKGNAVFLAGADGKIAKLAVGN